MKYILIALALLFVGIAAAQPAHAQARWQHYGADHAYGSKAAAKADAANVFRRAGWPPQAISAMVAKMREAPERITLRNGDRLDFMRSGPSGLWRNVLVDFRGGRGITIIADADRWTISVGGVSYEAILPDVCNNLAGRRSGNECRYVDFDTRHIEEVSVHYGYPSDDPCWGYREVSASGEPDSPTARWVKPPPCRDACDFSQAVQLAGQPRPGLIGTIRLRPGYHQFRVSAKFLALCLEYAVPGAARQSSFTAGVRPNLDYVRVVNVWRARVWYQSNELPSGVRTNGPRGLFFWASTRQEEAAIRSAWTAGGS